jgi:hypothetical protein
VARGVESNPINPYMFWIENDERYIGLQAPIPLPREIQTTTIIRGVPFMPTNLVGVTINGRVPYNDNDSVPNTMNEFVGSSNSNSDGN